MKRNFFVAIFAILQTCCIAAPTSNASDTCTSNVLNDNYSYVKERILSSKFRLKINKALRKGQKIPVLGSTDALKLLLNLSGVIPVSKITDFKVEKKDSLFKNLSSYYFEDKTAYSICVDAFVCGGYDLQDQLNNQFTSESREDFLKEFGDRLKQGVLSYRKKCFQRWGTKDVTYDSLPYLHEIDKLYALLPLNENEKAAFLKKKNVPITYQARLGVSDSIKRLIQLFEDENSDARKKGLLAEQLGIVGGPECAKALIRSLGSPLNDTTFSDNRKTSIWSVKSIKVPILFALTRINPNAPFRYNFYIIYQEKDEVYGGPEKIAKFIQSVLDWAQNTYGVKPDQKVEPFFISGLPIIY